MRTTSAIGFMAPTGWMTYWAARLILTRVNLSLFDRMGLSVLIAASALAALAFLGWDRHSHR